MSGGQTPPAPGTGEQTEGQAPATEGQTPPVAPPVDEPPKVDWRDRRIGEQQARLRERNARIAELEAQLRGQPTPQPGAVPPAGQPTYQQPPQAPGDIQRQITEAAAQMAAASEFTRRCNEVAESGRRVFTNFDQRVQRLTGLVDPNDNQQVVHYNAFLNAAMETGEAARLIYDLGGDLNEASRIMAMEPVKMAVELTRLASRVSTTDRSNAPPPINPLGSAANSLPKNTLIQPDDADQSDNLSTEEWMRRREEQVASRRQRTLG